MSALVLQHGLIVTVAATGEYSGKPRPAVIVQANRSLQGHPSVTLCLLTSTLLYAPMVRIPVTTNPRNRLKKASQLMYDRLFTVPTTSIGGVVGVLEHDRLSSLDLALSAWLDLA